MVSHGAEKGDRQAQRDLGLMYIEGPGVRKDENEGAKWLKRAGSAGET